MFTEQQFLVYFTLKTLNKEKLSYKTTFLVTEKRQKMIKLQFEFAVIARSDGKTKVIAITSITSEGGKFFAIPEDVTVINNHKELIKTPNFAKVKNSLKRRHQTGKVWIKLEEALKDTYIDKDENIQFMDQYLEQIVKEQEVENKDDLRKIREKLVEATEKKELLKKFSVKKGTLPLRWVSSPGPFDCRSNALSSELRKFHNFSHRILLTPIRLRMYPKLFNQYF